MALDLIRIRLAPGGKQYTHAFELVADVRLMFKNAYAFNPVSINDFFLSTKFQITCTVFLNLNAVS